MLKHSHELLRIIKDASSRDNEISALVYKNVLDYISLESVSPSEKEQVFENIADEEIDIYKKIFFHSVSISINHSKKIFDRLIDFIWDNREEIQMDTMNYLYWQFIVYIFVYPELNSIYTKAKVWKLLDFNVSRYEILFQDLLNPICSSDRDDGFVLVLTDQFISFQHGPTKTAVDRCKILIEAMNKKVLLLNTAEILSSKGMIPFFNAKTGIYNNNLIDSEYVDWKSCRIPYFQCENVMPDINMIRTLLSLVSKLRPIYVISIGRGGILATLIAKIIPTLSIGLLPSELDITGIPFQTLSRPLNEDDKKLLKLIGRSEDSVVIGTFGSSILQQSTWITREEAKLPSETWLAVLVGTRLDSELTGEFWDMAEAAGKYGLEYVILGSYSQANIDLVEKTHPSLKDKIHNIGFVEDVLCYMDLCDLYINPIRSGGGTSCVEALSMGIPVITTSFGDVAVNVGEQFQTDSYSSMVECIQRYMFDFEFYKSQSQAAKRRSEILLNAEESFKKIITDFIDRTNK